MKFENVDVQWTVASESSAQEMIRSMQTRASELGWIIKKVEITDAEGAVFPDEKSWPAETFGSMSYSRGEDGTQRALFWSTYTRDGVSKVTGGLYIQQYAAPDIDFYSACRRALDDILALFGSNDACCVVLALEDDEGIDLAPGIIGCYRPTLWQQVAAPTPHGLTVRASGHDWLEVHPTELDTKPLLSVTAMSEQTRSSLTEMQKRLVSKLWGPV